MFDLEKLEKYVSRGLISRQKHPTADLYIYNYTPRVQYERIWDEVTTACRGLILDESGMLVARPFPKFFNLDEHSRSDITFSKPFKVYEKLDGSLGIMYRIPGTETVGIATRGSFTSPQALKATEIYQRQHFVFKPAEGTTPLFEIIYPSNRIVVDYGDREDLVLLTVIDNNTGRDIPDVFWVGPRAQHFKVDEDTKVKPRDVLSKLGFTDDGNTEGVVMVFDWPKEGPKTRVKVKLDEYKRLHRILTGISTKTIWETLKAGLPMDEVLDRVPDEFYTWVTDVTKELMDQYTWAHARVVDSFDVLLEKLVPDGVDDKIKYAKENRKEFAELAAPNKYRSFLFCLLDGKDISEKLWDTCRPEYSKAFAADIDS